MAKDTKPLGQKAYGSIPHLPGSRMGPGDHHCHPGQQAICWEKTRDRHDRIIVTEKLDGGNVAVARIDDQILALGRAGYLASTSPFVQHHIFAEWVERNRQRFADYLFDGERVNGEWLAQAHGTRYALPHEPFVVFDLMHGSARYSWHQVVTRAMAMGLPHARVLSDCHRPMSLADALAKIETSGHGALDPVEGAVWRVERKDRFDFIAKYVRPEKIDGTLLPEISGKPAVWNWIAPWRGDLREPA